MIIEEEMLKDIEDYYFGTNDEESRKTFEGCYDLLRNCNCVKSQDEDTFIYCLHLIAFDISSNRFFRTATNQWGEKIYGNNNEDNCKKIVRIICSALYEAYQEKAIPTLKNLFGTFRDVPEDGRVEVASERDEAHVEYLKFVDEIRETEKSNIRIRIYTM